MRISLISSDRELIDSMEAVCRQGLHELSVSSQWPPAEVSCGGRGLVLFDVESAGGNAASIDPQALQRAGWVVLIESGRKQRRKVDDALVFASSDVWLKPLDGALVSRRLELWDRLDRQQHELELLGERVDELATARDRQAYAAADMKDRQTLAAREQSRLGQVLEKLQMVTRLSRLINCLDLKTIVEACIDRVPLLVGARLASLYFYDQRSGHLILERHNHPKKIADRVDVSETPNSPMSLAIRRRKLVLIRDFSEFEAREHVTVDRGFTEHYTTGSCIIAPLMSGHRVIGVLNLADKVDGGVFDNEIDLPATEQLCELIGASIYNIELFREVERQAKTDGMTGLANHRSFIEGLGREFDRAQRYRSKLSLLMIDMDNLKTINDNCGHQAGDLAISHVSRVISDSVRTSDIAARYGGDEFAIVLIETTLRQAQVMARRLISRVRENPLELNGERITLTLSIGVGELAGDGSVEEFIKRVDDALYEAKRSGRNRMLPAADASNGRGDE